MKRLASLDLLRGADIFYLTVVGTFVVALGRILPLPGWLMSEFRHPEWVGFNSRDLIMPLFIFMCGAALPLAMTRRLGADGRAGWDYWGHVLSRMGLLWLLGMLVDGNLLSFDLRRISFFSNTLQAIACGYLLTAVAFLIRSQRVRLAIPAAFLVLYGAFLLALGDMTPTGNAAAVYETKFLLLFYPDASWAPVRAVASSHYVWWVAIPMFGVFSLVGAEATTVVVSSAPARRKIALLCAAGAALLALGGACSVLIPPVKHIFTPSFTMLATGACVLLYALFYWLFDVHGIRRGTGLVARFGRRSLCAYMMYSGFGPLRGAFCDFWLSDRCSGWPNGLSRLLGRDAYSFAYSVLGILTTCLVVWAWDEWHRRSRLARQTAGA